MKLLIGCSSSPDKGSGILTYTKEIINALIESSHEIHLACPQIKNKTWIEKKGIFHIETNQNDSQSGLAKSLITYVNANNISGVINNDNSLVQSIAPAISCPFIAIGHFGRTSIASLACYQHESSDYIVAISNEMQRRFVDVYKVPTVKCPIIYNGISDPGHEGGFSKKIPSKIRAVYVGGYSKRKGADLIFNLVKFLDDKPLNIQIDWFGNVPEKLSNKLSTFTHLNIHGSVDRPSLLNYIRDADVLLFPSREEGCPMAMLEAMAYGIIPIASDGIGAMDVLITSGKNGYICPINDWARHAYSCLSYISKMPTENLCAMKKETRSIFLKHYTSETVANELIRLINNPTVDRQLPSKKINVLKWHRPFRADGLKAPLLDRICIRLGKLRSDGDINI